MSLQVIAQENNFGETAFIVQNNVNYELPWFTLEIEVELCDHATLAAAYVLFYYHGHIENTIRFYSWRSEELLVEKARNEDIAMNFP